MNNVFLHKVDFGHNKIILGIDPGSVSLGFSIVRIVSDIKNQVLIISYGSLNLAQKIKNTAECIYFIYSFFKKEIDFLLKEFNSPQHSISIAIEKQFLGKNFHSVDILIQIRTVFLLLAGEYSLIIEEAQPSEIRKIVMGEGCGNASKELVKEFLMNFFSGIVFENYDESDSLLIALYGLIKKNKPSLQKVTLSKEGKKESV
jgi:Holliday junction resolvasome RuvABC endonuclease subunit